MRIEFEITGYNANGEMYDSAYCFDVGDAKSHKLFHDALDEFLANIQNPKTGKSDPVFRLNICDLHN